MKIQLLFDELKIITENKESVFTESGMTNWSDKMKYGFFPLGFGVLTDNITIDSKASEVEISEGGVMILGNDFGTVSYVDSYVNNGEKKIGETDGKTVRNLLDESVVLNKDKTFFTNFYLGVRLVDGDYKGTTMIKRIFKGKENKLKGDYKKLCYEFFTKQLELVNPKLVICLGHDVKNALIESEVSESFTKWKPKSISIKKIHDENNHIILNSIFGNRKFIIIPHPCDLRNFTKKHKEKLNEILETIEKNGINDLW